MRIDKNSKLYKVSIVVVLLLMVAYYIYTWNNGGDIGYKGDAETTTTTTVAETGKQNDEEPEYRFYNKSLLEQHYEKHGIEMGFESAEEYEAAASKVVTNKKSLHKIEEDGDDVYYLEETNEFVIVSTTGYIRTYFYPSDGLDYFNRQ